VLQEKAFSQEVQLLACS